MSKTIPLATESLKLNLKELQEIETEILRSVVAICHAHNLTYYLVYGSALGTIRHAGPIPWDYDVDIAIPYPELERFLEIMRAQLPQKYYVNYNDNDPNYPELFPRIGLHSYSTKTLHLDVFLLIGAPNDTKKHKKFKNKAKTCWFLYKFKNFNPVHFGEFKSLKQKLFAPAIKTLLWPFPKPWVKRKFKSLCEAYPFDQANFVVNAQFGYSMKEFIPKEYYAEGAVHSYAGMEVRIPKEHHKYLRHIYGDYMQFPSEKNRQTPDYYIITKQDTSNL